MKSKCKRSLSIICVALFASLVADDVHAQSGTRGGYAAQATTTPRVSAPAQRSIASPYNAPSPPVNRYQSPIAAASNPRLYSPAPVQRAERIYSPARTVQPRLRYSPGYSGAPYSPFYRSYTPAYSSQSYYGGFNYGRCGN